MEKGFDPRAILHGNDAKMWMGGTEVVTGISLEAKLNIDNENVNVLGKSGTYSRFNGFSGTATMKRYKTDSSYILMIVEYVKTGIMPDGMVVISSVAQPLTGKVERVAFKEISFTEATLSQLEAKALMQEEIPFDFGDFEVLEAI